MSNKLPVSFYQDEDVTHIAKKLLGQQLWTCFKNNLTGGIIVEVEAYCGATDAACHAFRNKRTPRTQIMYEAGGVAYVYLVYGMHHLFNVVTNRPGSADAVLIRAIEPLAGEDMMKKRRKLDLVDKFLTGGPARLSQALGITTTNTKTSLQSDQIWLSKGEDYPDSEIVTSTRIGVEYAGDDALLPWRFHIKGNKFVSK